MPDPDHQLRQRRRLPRPIRAFSSPDSYGLVLLLLVVTYTVSATATAAWAVSFVLFVQIATIWRRCGQPRPAAASARSPPPSSSSRPWSQS
jgi:hypothetical protein